MNERQRNMERATSGDKLAIAPILPQSTPAQVAAVWWRGRGVQVAPVYPRTKIPAAKWRFMRTLLPDDPGLLRALFVGDVGVCVFTGQQSGNLVYLDCENADALSAMADRLQRAGIELFGQQSGNQVKRGGGFFLRCADGEVKNRGVGPQGSTLADSNGEIIPDVELFGELHVVVTWPTVHEQGGVYRPYPGNTTHEPPTVTLAQLQAIFGRITLVQQRQNAVASMRDASSTAPPWDAWTAALLSGGISLGNRFISLQHIASDVFGCVADGTLTASEAESLLDQAASSCGFAEEEPSKYRGLKRYWQQNASTSHKRYHGNSSGAQTTQDNASTADKAAAWMHSHSWRGRSGTTDRRVFQALVERCRLDEKGGKFRASMREVSVLSGVSRGTVQRSIERLQAAGYVERVATTRRGAGVYCFAPTARAKTAPTARRDERTQEQTKSGEVLQSGTVTSIPYLSTVPKRYTSDATQIDLIAAIGATPAAILQVLQSGTLHPQSGTLHATPAQLAATVGKARCTVQRGLSKLIDLDLAERVGYGRYRAVSEVAQNVARVIDRAGTHNTQENLRKKYDQERAGLAVWAIARMRQADRRPGQAALFTEAWNAYRLHRASIDETANITRLTPMVSNLRGELSSDDSSRTYTQTRLTPEEFKGQKYEHQTATTGNTDTRSNAPATAGANAPGPPPRRLVRTAQD